MRKLVRALILGLAPALALAGCGANAKAVEHAELQCLEADLESAASKYLACSGNLACTAVSLSESEAVCAIGAVSAKAQALATAAGVGSAAPVAARSK